MINLKALAAPFPPERISWRVGSTTQDKKRGMALAYIDARDVADRLNEVCGALWQCRYSHAEAKTICEIGVKIGDEWIWRADGAGDTDFEAEKGAISDAFKRAAVKWGVGRYLYDCEAPWVEIVSAGKSYRIADHEMPKLRALLGYVPVTRPTPPTPPTKGFHLVDPKTGEVTVIERGGAFLDALEDAMAKGDPVQVWAVNGSTAKLIADKFPHAAKRVAAIQQIAMIPV